MNERVWCRHVNIGRVGEKEISGLFKKHKSAPLEKRQTKRKQVRSENDAYELDIFGALWDILGHCGTFWNNSEAF